MKDYTTVPRYSRLEDLFDGIHLVPVVSLSVLPGSMVWLHGHYDTRQLPGYLPLCGLPGTVRQNAAVFVRPRRAIAKDLQARSLNGVIGGFRIIRSAELKQQGLLPVYGYDFHRTQSVLIGLLPYSEHERFNTKGQS